MAVKPIIEIDVNDAAFKRFLSLYEQYSTALDEQPEKWRKLDAAMAGAGGTLKEGALSGKEALALAAAQAGVIAESLEKAAKSQEHLGTASMRSGKAMDALHKSASGVGQAISLIAGGIAKIAAFGGLGAIFGGIGLDRLAGSALTRFREAGRLGITPGKLASFGVNLQEFLGPEALGAAANAQIDLSKAGALKTLGIDFNRARKMDTGDLAIEELRLAAKAYREDLKSGLPPMQDPRLGYAYRALGGDIDDARLTAQPGGIELLNERQRAYHRDVAGLELPPGVKREWDDLKITLDKAGVAIETDLIQKLGPLAPKFEKITLDLIDFIAGFVGSKEFDKAVHGVADGLGQITTFLENVDWKGLGSDFQKLGTFANWLTGPIVIAPGSPADKLFGKNGPLNPDLKDIPGDLQNIWNGMSPAAIASLFGKEWNTLIKPKLGDAWKFLTSPIARPASAAVLDTAKGLGVDPLLALAMAQQESGINPKSKGDYVKGRATSFGLFQLHEGGELGDLTPEQAFDPATNSKVALGVLKNMLGLSKQAALNRFSRAVRASGVSASHAQIAALSGSPGLYAAIAQRPADPFGYAQSVNQKYAALASGLDDGLISSVNADIKKYGKDWMAHLPHDVVQLVQQANISAAERNNPHVDTIDKALRAVLKQRTPKPVSVNITNSTPSRVAVSHHAAAF